MSYGGGYGDGYGFGGGVRVEIDWTKTGAWVDETAYVRPRAGLSAQYGRDQATAVAPTVSGVASFTLDNRDGRFSSRNVLSPLYGLIKPGRPVRITRTVGATDCTVFAGHTDDTPLNPDPNSQQVSVSCIDWLADFRGHTITTSLYSGIRTGQAIGYILDAAGWTGGRDLDAGATVIPWWWETSTDATTALENVLKSEGPPALLTVGADGGIVFRDRHHRLSRANAQTPQATFVSVPDTPGTAPLLTMHRDGFAYDEAWDHIVNQGSAEVTVRGGATAQTVWEAEDTYSLLAAEERLITAVATDPFFDAVVPVDGVDFETRTGTVTVTLLRTSGTSATIKLTASGGGPAVVVGLKLRATMTATLRTTQVSFEDAISQADYGTRSFPNELPWCSTADALAVLRTAVALRADPLTIVRCRILVGTQTGQMSALGLDIGDRVTVIEPHSATESDFFIESITHELSDPSYADHAVIFGLEAAPGSTQNVMVLNDAARGLLNTGRLGNRFTDVNRVVILDTSELNEDALAD